MIKVDLSGFDDWEKNLKKLSDRNDNFVRNVSKKAGAYLQKNLIESTPVGEPNPLDSYREPGRLRSTWSNTNNLARIQNPVQNGRNYEIELINDAKNSTGDKFGSFVDEGHHQEVGRYVAQIQASLVRPEVEGVRFMEKALFETEQTIGIVLENEIQKEFDKVK